MKKFALPILLTGLVTPAGSAHAHVRWFAGPETARASVDFPADLTTTLILVGAVLFAALAAGIQRVAWPRGLREWVARVHQVPTGTEWRLVAFLTGIMFLANSTMRVFLAPNLPLHGEGLVTAALAAQAVLGVFLLSQISFAICGMLILITTFVTALLVPPTLFMNYFFEFVALGVALLLVGPALSPVDQDVFRRLGLDARPHGHLALPILRVGLGVTLVILALDEKLLHPGLSLAFLEEHPLNFMLWLGFEDFSDLHFVLAAGVAELVFGVLLVAGVATRFVTAVLSVFFVLSLLALGPVELVGHAPLFGIAFLFISRGAGEHVLIPPARSVEPQPAPAPEEMALPAAR